MASQSRPLRFAAFDVTEQVFVEREHTIALVNLKPIVPLHVLVVPRNTSYVSLRDIPRTPQGRAELHELMEMVQDVVQVCRKLTGAPACTIAIQDGKEAGQSVPHLHVHILPRKAGDFTPKDAIYPHLEDFELGLHKDMAKHEAGDAAAAPDDQETATRRSFAAPDDEERKPRTREAMQKEANFLRGAFQSFLSSSQWSLEPIPLQQP